MLGIGHSIARGSVKLVILTPTQPPFLLKWFGYVIKCRASHISGKEGRGKQRCEKVGQVIVLNLSFIIYLIEIIIYQSILSFNTYTGILYGNHKPVVAEQVILPFLRKQ